MVGLAKTERWIPYAMLAPALAGLVVFKLWPIGLAFWQSTFAYSMSLGRDMFVGLQNYADLAGDPVFWRSLGNTLVFNVVVNPIQTASAFALALVLSREIKGIGVYRALVMAPIAVSITVTSILWGLMLNPSFGLINGLLQALHLPPQPFLTSAAQALPSIVVLSTWRGASYWMVFFLAGLKDVPTSLHEAASLDGAGRWGLLRHITVPLLKRVFAFVLVADTAVNFLLFVPVFLLTAGGPQMSTNLLMYEAYKQVFTYIDPGHGMAITSILLVFILATVTIELRLLRTDEGT